MWLSLSLQVTYCGAILNGEVCGVPPEYCAWMGVKGVVPTECKVGNSDLASCGKLSGLIDAEQMIRVQSWAVATVPELAAKLG